MTTPTTLHSFTAREWAEMRRDAFYAIALRDSGGSHKLAEFATRRLYDSGWLKERAYSYEETGSILGYRE